MLLKSDAEYLFLTGARELDITNTPARLTYSAIIPNAEMESNCVSHGVGSAGQVEQKRVGIDPSTPCAVQQW